MIKYTEKIKLDMEQYKKMREQILLQQNIDPDKTEFDIREYAKHVLYYGLLPEKREIIKALGGMIYIHNQFVCSAPSR
ncbi:hypothetical protein HYW42_02290 [Candidatus Daviesbacteria bacterium]|nr:hypothetical protein [Candidatus Daviesbacteria bacterium]